MTIPPPPKLSDVGRRVLDGARERDARKGAQDWEAETLDEKCTPEEESTGGEVGERISQHEVDQAVHRLRVKDAALRVFRAEQAGPVSRPPPARPCCPTC